MRRTLLVGSWRSWCRRARAPRRALRRPKPRSRSRRTTTTTTTTLAAAPRVRHHRSPGPTAATASSAPPSPCPSTGPKPTGETDGHRAHAPSRGRARPAHRVAGRELRRSRRVGRRLPAADLRSAPADRARPLRRRELRSARHRRVATDRLRRRRVPRPVGRHSPRCPTTQPSSSTRSHDYNAQFAAGCMQRMGAYAGQVGTRNVARDLEAIRIALGDPKLTYLGYSYGTVVGATYAQMFPASVGRLVLDGPPDYWISARDYAYRQGKGFMDALERVPRLVPADRVLAGGVGRAARPAEPAHRARRPAADAGVVRRATASPATASSRRACSRTRCSRCSTTARAVGRSSPTRSARR